MKRVIIYVLTIASAALLPACGGNGKSEGKSGGAISDMALANSAEDVRAVSVMPLERTVFYKQMLCNGQLEAYSKASLQFRASGTVSSVKVGEGDFVKKGQILASLDSTDYARQLRSAEIQMDKARLNLADRLLDYGYSLDDTSSMPSELKKTILLNSGFTDACMAMDDVRGYIENCVLRAPFSGRVANLQGRAYEPGGQLCTLVDDSRFLIHFPVLEPELDFIHQGQTVLVSPLSDKEKVMRGKIISINPAVSQNGQIGVTAMIPGRDGFLDGMNVRVTVQDSVPGQLVVPKNAVIVRDGREVLFKYVDGRSIWTYVNVVMSNSIQHVIVPDKEKGSLLDEGDLVVISGNMNLGDNVPIVIE